MIGLVSNTQTVTASAVTNEVISGALRWLLFEVFCALWLLVDSSALRCVILGSIRSLQKRMSQICHEQHNSCSAALFVNNALGAWRIPKKNGATALSLDSKLQEDNCLYMRRVREHIDGAHIACPVS